jgi:predicted DNA-binding protein (UPF0251 family)
VKEVRYVAELHVAVPSSDIEQMLMGGNWSDPHPNHLLLVEKAVGRLSPREQEAIRGWFYERLTFEELGARLGCSKPHAWRITQAALTHLTHMLEEEPMLMTRINPPATWDEASRQIIDRFDRTQARAALVDTISYCARRMAEAVANHQEPQPMLFNTIGCEAVAELKDMRLWSPDSFHGLLCSKQADYGHQNILTFGSVGLAVRINDKVARLNNLLAKGCEARNEPLVDTWSDLVGYAVVAEMLDAGTFTLELESR